MNNIDTNIDTAAEQSKTPTFDALNLRQKQFILNYIEKRVAWKAYLDAFATKDNQLNRQSCEVNSSKLLSSAKIKKALQEKLASYWSDRDKEIGRIFAELQTLAYSDISNYIDEHGEVLNNFSGIDTRAIKSITVNETDKGTFKKIELHSKQAALTELADILNLKKTAIDITSGNEPLSITINYK